MNVKINLNMNFKIHIHMFYDKPLSMHAFIEKMKGNFHILKIFIIKISFNCIELNHIERIEVCHIFK